MNAFFRWWYRSPTALRRLPWLMLPIWVLALLLDVLSPWFQGGISLYSSALLVFFLASERPLRSVLPFLLLGIALDYMLARSLGTMALMYSGCFLGGVLAGLRLPPRWRYYAIWPSYGGSFAVLTHIMQQQPFNAGMWVQTMLAHTLLAVLFFMLWRLVARPRGTLIRQRP